MRKVETKDIKNASLITVDMLKLS